MMLMYKRLFLLCLLMALCTVGTFAQTAREVLDATAAQFNSRGGVRTKFKATQFSGTTPQDEASGTLLLRGQQFQVKTAEMTVWYDGKTQWAMLSNSGEVNVTEPTEEERAAMNPSVLLNIYKKGYSLSLRKTSLRGKPTFEVYLRAKNKKAAFSEIYVDVEQGTYTPLCFRAKKDGDWMRLSIYAFQTGTKLSDDTFAFPEKDFPDVEVIDLR